MSTSLRQAKKNSRGTRLGPTPQPHPMVPLGSVTRTRDPSFAEGISNALSNPLRSLRLSVESQLYLASKTDFDGWVVLMNSFLSNIHGLLDGAWAVLGKMNNEMSDSRMPEAGLGERVRARVLLSELADWLTWTSMMRSCIPPGLPPHQIEVNEAVLGKFVELDHLGRVLKMIWVEANGGTATLRSGLAEAESRLRAALPIAKTNHLFAPARMASDLTGIGVDVLKTRRHNGDRSPDKRFGIDGKGLIWIKPGKDAQVLYLKSSLPLKKLR